VDEVVNGIKGLGRSIDDKEVILKVLRTLPKAYSHKVSAIEELQNLNHFTKD